MIEVAGIQGPRASMIDLAHRMVLTGEIGTAARILDGVVHHDRITLEITDREAILAELRAPPRRTRAALRRPAAELVGRHRQGLA